MEQCFHDFVCGIRDGFASIGSHVVGSCKRSREKSWLSRRAMALGCSTRRTERIVRGRVVCGVRGASSAVLTLRREGDRVVAYDGAQALTHLDTSAGQEVRGTGVRRF